MLCSMRLRSLIALAVSLELMGCVTSPAEQPDDGQKPITWPAQGFRWFIYPTVVYGWIHPPRIQLVMRGARDRIRECFDAGYARNPELAGRIVVNFVIDTDGSAKSVSAHSTTLADREVVACVVDRFREIGFPQPDRGTVTVQQPMSVEPERQKN